MSILNIVALLGGLALFLYGVHLMGDGLNKVAGNKLQGLLYRLTSNPFKGILLGIGVTALIQSSSATSVMAIGFVNSGLMEFSQAVSIILGSILGTSITGWIVSISSLGGAGGWTSFFSTAFITGVLATIGIILFKFSKKQTRNQIGTILLGLAVLMFGMGAMSDAVSPLRDNAAFTSLLTKFSNPFLGILVGLVFTAIIQSSAAAVGILQALSMSGLLSFSEAFPIILGIAVGGAVPVLLSALGASLNARRTALVHLIIDIAGALFCGVVFYAVNAIHPFSFMEAAMTPVTVAGLNTIFRFITVLLLTPMIGLLEKLTCLLMKEKPGNAPAGDWDLLEERFLAHPALAIEQCRIVLNSMAGCVRENITDALALLHDYSDEGCQHVQEMEELVDQYEDKLGTYMVQITSAELMQVQNEQLYQFLHAITDLERISDHAANIADNAREMHEKEVSFSDGIGEEIAIMEAALTDVVDTMVRALTRSDQTAAHRVEPLAELIETLCAEMKHRHIERLQKGVYSRRHSFVFNDLITNYTRVSDHCSNIAVSMIELDHDAFDLHNYVESLRTRKDTDFNRYFKEYQKKYEFPELADTAS